MKRIFTLTTFLLLHLMAFPQTWNGSVSTDWNTADNWTPSGVPVSGSSVHIPTGQPRYPVLANSVVVDNINMETGSQLDFNGFTLTLTTNASTYNFFNGAVLTNSNAASDIVITINLNTAGYGTYFWGNTVNDRIRFNLRGAATNFFYDSHVEGNTYNGNVIFNFEGAVAAYISDGAPSQYNGNVTVSRTVEGLTRLFQAGANITGDFSYTNNTTGITNIGTSDATTKVSGALNISVNYTTPDEFQLTRLVNQTTGGTIHVQNTLGFNLQRDTLRVASLTISDYRGAQYGNLSENDISGLLTITSHAMHNGGFGTYIRSNKITGNTVFTNNGSDAMIEADLNGSQNFYVGNVTFNAFSSAQLSISSGVASQYNGNFTLQRTVAGTTTLFGAGANISGNFSYTNNAGGNTVLGSVAARTSIGGTVNMAVNHSTPDEFHMSRIINQTSGGTINIQHTLAFDIQRDTLLVNSFSLTGYKGTQSANFLQNQITGSLTITDDASNGAIATYVRSNIISGNSAFTLNGSAFNDADIAGTANKYLGNVSYVRNNGTMNIGASSMSEFSGNLTLNSASGILLGRIKFTGTADAMVEQIGTQPIDIKEVIMQKAGSGKIILNDPVTVSATLHFISGLVVSSMTNLLTFANDATTSGASDLSYVDGPVAKRGDDAFIFPLGKGNEYAPIGITAPVSTTDAFRAQYFRSNPAGAGYNPAQKESSLQSVSSREYWLLDRTAGASAVKVGLSWDTDRSGVVNSLPDLRVARWNGTWRDEGNGGTTGNNDEGTVESANAIGSFSPFTLASASVLNVLPVALSQFRVRKENHATNISWRTASETNLKLFEVERSNNGRNYSNLQIVTAQGSGANHYETVDAYPAPGKNYYRLKVVDRNGNFVYSQAVLIDFSSNASVRVYPNPCRELIHVYSAEFLSELQVFDVTGKVVKRFKPSTNHLYDVQNLRPGVYVIKVKGLTSMHTSTFLKL